MAEKLTDIPTPVRQVFDSFPAKPRKRMEQILRLILAAGEAADVGGVEETLKWGQPSYLPKKPRTGTTVRLGWSPSDPDNCALYVHCQTTLVDQFRERFPSEFAFEGNRAVLIPMDKDLPKAALQHVAAMAFTYHRNKS